MSRGQISAASEPPGGKPHPHRVPHSLQDDVVLRVALWVLMGGTAAESILAANAERLLASATPSPN
jgi:hypothetical protein